MGNNSWDAFCSPPPPFAIRDKFMQNKNSQTVVHEIALFF